MNRELFGRSRQRGAAIIMTAGFMLLGVLCLVLVVDTGRLYMEKRSLQRVADAIALEVASRRGCVPDSGGVVQAQSMAASALTRMKAEGNAANGAKPVAISSVTCGVVSGNPRIFASGGTDAVQVVVTHTVQSSLVAAGMLKGDTQLTARAVAARPGNPLARLTIRSQVASVDSSQSVLLNAVLGNLLGSNLNLSVLDWQSLAGANINLLDLIGVNGLELGSYEELLTTDVTLANLMLASADVLRQGGNTAAANALDLIRAVVGPLALNVGDLLGLETGLPSSAADVNLNVLDLVQGAIQLATTDNAAKAGVPVSLPGLGTVTVRAQVTEKPRTSAVRDPRDINNGAGWITDPNYEPDEDKGDIFVRTAQIRLLLSLQLSGLTGALNTLLGSTTLLSPVINLLTAEQGALGFVGNLLSDIVGAVITVCAPCSWEKILYAEAGTLDIGLDVGGANAFVSGHSCGASKTLSALGSSELGRVYVGKIQNDANSGGFFASGSTVNVTPAPLLELGYRQQRYSSCVKVLGIGDCSNPVWKKGSGTTTNQADADKNVLAGIGAKTGSTGTPLAATPATLSYSNPPDLDQDPVYKKIVLENTISALSSTLSSLELKAYKSSGGGLLGAVLGTVLSTINGLLPAVSQLLSGLAGLLDPVVNGLLKLLGVSLANAEVGGNLSCSAGDVAELVN